MTQGIEAKILMIKNITNEGRYILCSNITSTIGIILDSSDRVIKNHAVPNKITIVRG